MLESFQQSIVDVEFCNASFQVLSSENWVENFRRYMANKPKEDMNEHLLKELSTSLMAETVFKLESPC